MTQSAALNIFSGIKTYRKLSQELQSLLAKNPQDINKFQGIFNLTVDRLYQDIMRFEKENITESESDIYKLRQIFMKRYRRFFLYGEYINWCLKKPFGYAGDFMIIDKIYKNTPQTIGFERLWDNWVMQLPVSVSVRARKEEFKNIIQKYVENNKNRSIKIMNLASGPAREIKELVEYDKEGLYNNVKFDCYDFDLNAIDYAKKLLSNVHQVAFTQKNAIRLALKKNIEDEIKTKYDIIYSTGLFDYLDERVAKRLITNLNKLLNKNGIMIISNAGEKYNNSSAIWMEWVGEWFLIYRTQDEFKKIFLDIGFSEKNFRITLQKDKVMQYCLVYK